jgi:hypothetical protein
MAPPSGGRGEVVVERELGEGTARYRIGLDGKRAQDKRICDRKIDEAVAFASRPVHPKQTAAENWVRRRSITAPDGCNGSPGGCDRNTGGRLLLAVSAVLCAAGKILLAVRLPAGSVDKIEDPCRCLRLWTVAVCTKADSY